MAPGSVLCKTLVLLTDGIQEGPQKMEKVNPLRVCDPREEGPRSTEEVARGISCGMCRPRVAVGEARPRAHHPDTWARHWAAAMPPTTREISFLGQRGATVLPTPAIRCRGGCVDELFPASSLTAPRQSLGVHR